MKKELIVKNINVNFFSRREDDFISLTDIAKYKNKETTGLVISHWLSTRYTVEFMGLWEQMHNSDFNVTEFRNIKNEPERLQKLNEIAISQMKVLFDNSAVKKLETKK